MPILSLRLDGRLRKTYGITAGELSINTQYISGANTLLFACSQPENLRFQIVD